MCKRGFRLSNALKYDANGNVWLDGYNKSAYILNSIGMPEHIALYSEVPSKLSPIDVDQETVYDEEFANMFWKFANFDSLAQEPLFQRLMNL